MKSSLRKLRGFSLGKHGAKDKLGAAYYGQKKKQQPPPPPASLDELVQASQDIQDMLECYEGLMLTSARAANSVFEFSEALQDVATCLLEKTALNIDEDSGRVLLMLGKVQYDLHKLLDRYRAHIAQTITTPSESLLSELKIVEEMREQCEEKRKAYESMRAEGVKGKSKTSKGETVSSQTLQSAKEDYDQQATLLVCRLMSLKQGMPRSLLTQAARHYTSQLHLFKKGLASLEALEPHVKQIAEQYHIDYQLGELEEDDGEVSFEFSQNDHEYDESTSSENSMQLDGSDPSPIGSSVYVEPSQSQANPEKDEEYGFVTARRSTVGSKSAPIIPSSYGKSDGIEKVPDMQPSMATQRNLPTYALPIPVGAKSGNITGVSNSAVGTRPVVGSGAVSPSWHMPPLEQFKSPSAGLEVASTKNDSNLRESGEISRSGNLLRHSQISRAQPLPEEPNSTSSVPPPLRFDTPVASDSKRIKRHAYSGPLTGKTWSSRPILHSSGPLGSRQVEPSFKSGPIGRSSISHAFGSSKISPSVSPPNLSPPHINKFYELPKPPNDSRKPSRSSNMIAHSAPLVAKKNQEHLIAHKPGQITSKPASPLPPPPPGLVTRSFSIPSSCQKGQILQLPKISEVSESIQITEEAPSPPLTPIPFPTSKGKLSSTGISDGAGHSLEVRSGQAVQLHGSSVSSNLG